MARAYRPKLGNQTDSLLAPISFKLSSLRVAPRETPASRREVDYTSKWLCCIESGYRGFIAVAGSTRSSDRTQKPVPMRNPVPSALGTSASKTMSVRARPRCLGRTQPDESLKFPVFQSLHELTSNRAFGGLRGRHVRCRPPVVRCDHGLDVEALRPVSLLKHRPREERGHTAEAEHRDRATVPWHPQQLSKRLRVKQRYPAHTDVFRPGSQPQVLDGTCDRRQIHFRQCAVGQILGLHGHPSVRRRAVLRIP